ncbi:MAG: OsmC family protein [Acidobacteriia bacterium]|nr:OsmC family protein [Terriglobia bacterium]
MAETLNAKLSWDSGLKFLARSDSGHQVAVDSTGRPGHAGPSPVELLLIAVAGCTAMDVVSILEKMHEPLKGLDVEIRGCRAQSNPKYFTEMAITYHARGAGLARDKVERAVELSQTTYCSVIATLRPDCRVSTSIELSEG